MSSGGGSFGTASVHVGADWTVRCCTYPATTPILSIDAGSTAVSVSIADRERMPAGGGGVRPGTRPAGRAVRGRLRAAARRPARPALHGPGHRGLMHGGTAGSLHLPAVPISPPHGIARKR